MFVTPLITYNLKERGRKYRGKDRHFNIKSIIDAINGGDCQERVTHRGMVGFYGHWPRLRFGMEPAEGGVAEGKAQAVEPALVTTFLKGYPDGTIEHKAEFLDTGAGILAAKLHQNRTGGFSSAIDEREPRLFGFDYVIDPNYTTNRGYALDSTGDLTLDDVAAIEYTEQISGYLALLDSAANNYDAVLQSVDRLQAENEELMSMLSKQGSGSSIVLDGIGGLSVDRTLADRYALDSAFFRNAVLPRVVAHVEERPEDSTSVSSRLLSRYGS